MGGPVQVEMLATVLAAAKLGFDEVWTAYERRGGVVGHFELRAFLAGALMLPLAERDRLADAVNGMLAGTDVTLRVPHSGHDDPGSTAGESRQILGVNGAFLLTESEQERERLLAVERTGLLDSPPEPRFDAIIREARSFFDVSSVIVALIDDRRMFLKAVLGPIEQNLPREVIFCSTTLLGAGPLIIRDTLDDERFAMNPLVLGAPFIRFYAGMPLRGPGGWSVGTLCVIDQSPREFSVADGKKLRFLARRVEQEIATS